MEMEQRKQNKLNVVEKQFNSPPQSWHQSMQQLCCKVPDFVVPPFIPISMENNANEEDDAIEQEENNFDEEHNFNEDQQDI